MKYIFRIILLLNIISLSAIADQLNFYAYFINNSTKAQLTYDATGSNINEHGNNNFYKWDNLGWSPCAQLNSSFIINPGEQKFTCGGSVNNYYLGIAFYDLKVINKANNLTLYNGRHGVVIHDDMGSYFELEGSTLGDLNNIDAVIIYVLNDFGMSVTMLNGAPYNTYSTSKRNFSLNKSQCSWWPDGCVIYIPFNTRK